MEDIWLQACRRYGVGDDVATDWYMRIVSRLSQKAPERCYHNWHELMQGKENLLRQCEASVVLAAFFQYYVYDGKQTRAVENCEVFEEFCRDADLEDADVKRLVRKLLGDSTIVEDDDVQHDHDNEVNTLQDLDLAILGSPRDQYKRYKDVLREEYVHMDEEKYRQMRLKVLQSLLMIPNIYKTTTFYEQFEQAARTNIEWEIEELQRNN